MITDRGDAIEAAAKARHTRRFATPWEHMTDAEKQYNRDDAKAMLDAIGYDELVASRERAIALACQFEEDVELHLCTGEEILANYTNITNDLRAQA